MILDGFGIAPPSEGNAISIAQKNKKMPRLDKILKTYPHTTVEASGKAVGLPAGVMGNSEVGHLTIGSGRIIYQYLSRVNRDIADGTFFKNEILKKGIETAIKNGSTLHLMGLLSDGGVHSHEKHLFALLQFAKKEGAKKIAVHAFLDGRDTPPQSSLLYLKALQKELKGVGEIATLIGRYYAMDRDKRWERVQIAYDALVEGIGEKRTNPIAAVEEAYREHITDEFIKPYVFGDGQIKDNDVVLFFNFRPDRARELTQALTDPGFTGFPRKKFPKLAEFVCMTEYDKKNKLPVAFPPPRVERVLAQVLSENKIPQFHTAETEKYAHVTYFLNGGIETPFPLEERLLVPSPRDVPTYDKKPEMNAEKLTEEVLKKLKEGCPVILMNFANPDMVGHSGVLPATVKAVEVIDDCIGKIVDEVLARKGTVMITADHGNCEEMLDKNGKPHTAHTTNPVPFILIGDEWKNAKLKSGGGLQDIAPTILKILNLPQPPEMTGTSLMK
jgi:2,3-bisphosphoglycerate-independent phosphoglycerate mutase